MVDFTGLPQLRNAPDLGGFYWAITLIWTQAVCVTSGWLYQKYHQGDSPVESTVVFQLLCSLAATWAVSFGAFLLLINRDYVHTFLSLESGPQYVKRHFHESLGDDARRMEIFSKNIRLWRSIQGEVQSWVESNYDTWKAEQPAWLTPGLLLMIPDDFLPKAQVAELDAAAPQGRRKSIDTMGLLERCNTVRLVVQSRELDAEADAADAGHGPSIGKPAPASTALKPVHAPAHATGPVEPSAEAPQGTLVLAAATAHSNQNSHAVSQPESKTPDR